jgi:hypothetical protein
MVQVVSTRSRDASRVAVNMRLRATSLRSCTRVQVAVPVVGGKNVLEHACDGVTSLLSHSW